MASKKLTIVKILEKDGSVTLADLERWRNIFAANGTLTKEEAESTGEVAVEEVDVPADDDNFITIVKVGDSGYKPSAKDMEAWRQVFEKAKNDDEPEFRIFTHPAVEITRIPIGKIIAVE
jgi:hypothetical protein